MTFGAATSLITMMVALLMALFTWGLSTAPGWRGLRWFSGVALSVVLYVVGSLTFTLPVSDGVVLAGTRMALIAGALHHTFWTGFGAVLEGRPLQRSDRFLIAVELAISVLALHPGLLFEDRVHAHRAGWSSTEEVYRVGLTNPLGSAALVFQGLASIWLFGRLVLATCRGTRGLLVHALSLLVLFAGAVGDVFIAHGHRQGPYLFTLGLLGVVSTVGFLISRRVVEDAWRLQIVSGELEQARRALVQRERLAAVGEITAVVAHEVRNPLGVLYNVFSQLRRRFAGDAPALGTVGEAVEASERIERTISDLLQAAHHAPRGGEDR